MAGGASIADLFFKALLDSGQLELDAAKAGDKAGQTMGGRMSKGIATTLRAGLGVMAAGAAIATRGLLELEQITADFTAETGATADEAKRAGQAINEMAGRNLQPMKEVGAVLTKVHTDLGLTGDAAEKTAERFLHFARVTKRDAATEVAAFDDILDAWGLTADDSQGLMDQLIKSHQEYGGVIAEDEAALKNLAPAMKALNFDVDDTIGLLNLFKDKGLDAATSQRAFNSAVAKLPPGTNLKDVLAAISAIEDPSKRAAAAIEVFGSRGGVALANALGPGIGAIEDYVITTDEAKGATDKAREAIDSTFSSRVQLAIKGITSEIIKLGAGFGPVLTGLAALASFGGALGLPKLLSGAFGKLAGSALVKGAARNAGLVIGAIFSGAMFVVDQLAGALSGALNKLPGSGLVKTGAGKVGGFLGSTLGKLAAAAFAAVMVFEVVNTYNRIQAEMHAQLAQISADAQALLKTGTDAALAQARAGLVQGIADLNNIWDFGIQSNEARERLEAELAATDAEIARRAAGFGPTIGAGLAGGADAVEAGAETGIFDPITGKLIEAKTESVEIAKATPRAIADSLRDGQFSVANAMDAIKDAMKNALSKAKEMAELEGFLTSQRLAKALNDGRPAVRAEAEAWRAAAEGRLFALRNGVPAIALATGQTYADALAAKKPAVATAAGGLAGAVKDKLTGLPAEKWGRSVGGSFADGLRSQASYLNAATAAYLLKMKEKLEANSPPGPASPLHEIDKWGARTGDAYANPLLARLKASVAQARNHLADLAASFTAPMGMGSFAAPGMPAIAMAGQGALGRAPIPFITPDGLAGGVGGAGGSVTNVNVQVPGLLRAETPGDVVRSLRHLSVYGTFGEERK